MTKWSWIENMNWLLIRPNILSKTTLMSMAMHIKQHFITVFKNQISEMSRATMNYGFGAEIVISSGRTAISTLMSHENYLSVWYSFSALFPDLVKVIFEFVRHSWSIRIRIITRLQLRPVHLLMIL